MPYKLTPDPNYALGHETVLNVGWRYADRARELVERAGGEGAGARDAFALAYLQGLVDMSALYAVAVYASSVETKLAEIDAHVTDLESGGRE